MASIGNYAAALAEAARSAARSSATGIGSAIRGSATSEMPGITGAYSFAQSLRNSANSRAGSSGGRGGGGGGGSASSSGSSDSSNFNSAVVRELQLVNANILEQTRLLRYQVDSNRARSQFEEENAREQALRDSRLLDAINNIGSSSGGGPAGGGGGSDASKGLLDKLGGGRGGSGGGGGGKGRRGSIGGKLLKGAGIAGLGLGALYAYNRVANGGESVSEVAKDMAPGVLGSTIGGLVGLIGGPIGSAIGAAVGGAIGDSDLGHKMFEKILPKFQELGDTIAGKFGVLQNWFSNFDVAAAASGAYKSVAAGAAAAGSAVSSAASSAYKSVSAGVSSATNQAGNILGNFPNPMGGKAAKQAAMRAGDASAATTSAVTGASDRAIDFIKKYEGKFQAKAYWDHKQWSIGYGTKANSKDEVITEEEGFTRMKADINKSAKSVIDYGKKYGYNWNQNQVDALTSFVYNGGPGFLAQVTNNGKRSNEQISQALLLYNKASGEVSKGLVARRGAEQKLFDTQSISTPASGPVKAPQSPGFNSARDSQAAYDAMPTTPAFTGPGFGSYKEGANPEADTSFSGSKIPETTSNKTSPLTQKMEEVRIEIRKAANATIKVAEKIGKDTSNNLKNLAQSTKRTADAVAPRNKPIRPILKTPEQIIAETNKNFANQFQKIAPKAISLALRQTLFPKGIGVSQQAAGGALFRGQQLNNIFGVGRSVNKLATSLFGKQYGGMLAPALNNLATGYLEAGARAGGRLLFGMIGGMGAEQSNILTGQILGNYTRGNKKLATEQLLFGTTGVATGYETIFAKYGFKNPMQGIEYMANTLGAAGSDVVNSYMDPGAKASQWIDPRTGKKVGLNSTSSFTADAYGRIGDTSSTGATIQTVSGGDKAITTTDIESANFAAEQAYRDELIIAGIGDTNRILAEGRTGSGSTAGGSLGVGGGGGFFGAGGPLGRVGNMAFDLGKVALTQNIVKGLGVKNPYMQMLANFAVNQGLKYAGQAAYSAVFGNATFANAAGQVAGGISNALGLGGTQAAAPIVDLAATGYAGAAGASYAGGASAGTLAGFESGVGTIGAAVPQTASAGGAAAGAGFLDAAAALAMNPATWIVAGFLVVGSLIMGQGDDPNPTIQRILWNADNNDIAKITTNWTFDWGYLDQKGQVAWIAVCDQMLRIAFNAAKAFQVKAGSLGTNIGAFDYIGTQINKWGVIIAFYRGTPQAPLGSSIDQIDFGTPEQYSKLNANEVAARIVKKVEELYKKGVTYDAKLTEELGKTAESLQKVSYNTIAAGLLSATAGQLDTSISRVTYMQPVEAQGPYESNEAGPVGGSPRGVFNEKTGSWVTDAPDNVVGYDINGKPIYDLNSDRMLSAADFKTSLSDIQAIIPSATATNTGNFIAAASAAGALAGAATGGAAGSASGGSTVVAGNNNNNTTNNTTVVRQVSSVDVLRGMAPQTALPASG